MIDKEGAGGEVTSQAAGAGNGASTQATEAGAAARRKQDPGAGKRRRLHDVSLTGVLRMTGRNWMVYRKTWYVNALPPLAEPFLYLLALGYGLGALIPEIEGVRYVAFIAPAIVGITMMQTAFFETRGLS